LQKDSKRLHEALESARTAAILACKQGERHEHIRAEAAPWRVAVDMIQPALFGGIEGGGTKFICAVGRSPLEIIDSLSIPTTDPGSTLAACVQFFLAAQDRHGPIGAFGAACFGPIELRRESQDFGCLLPTPKPGWSGANVLEGLQSAFDVPIVLDIDVGAAALAELRLGAGRGCGSLAYVTVGTGIGGAVAPARLDGRLMHAEMGHIPVRRDPRDGDFAGCCPFHNDCLEGLASGTAIRARWGCELDALPADHDAPFIIAGYLGQLAASIALMCSVERIVFGGGVMSDRTLHSHVRAATSRSLNGYVPALYSSERLRHYICSPGLGAQAGIVGALLLAQMAAG
jgi:fructokinase